VPTVKRWLTLPPLAALVGVPGLAAQETAVVYGSVRDTSGSPLRAAVTAVGRGQSSTADDQGRYRLSVAPGRTIVRVVHLGYAPVFDTLTLHAADSVERNYRLVPIAVELQPHVVTAAKRSQLLDQAVTSIVVLEQTEIARRAVTTVDEALDRAPGVQFLNGQVNIRGSSGYVQGLGSRVLLLVDGVPANQGDRGGINWDLVPLERVERVEVVKGAGSSLYGSSALGGVVNLITREIPLGLHARVRLAGSVFGDPPHDIWRFRDYTGAREGIDVSGSYGTDALRGSYSAGGWHSDGYREQDRRDHWQTGGKAEWRPAAGTVATGSGSWASDQYEVPLRWCVRGTCDDRGQAYQPFLVDTSGRGSHTRSDKGFLTLTLDRSPTPRVALHARGSWLRTHFTNFQPGNTDAGVANRFGAELRGHLTSGPGQDVTVGVEGARSDVESDIFGNHSQTELATYGESERVLGAARLTTGARIDFLAVDGGTLSAVVSPRAGAVLATARGAWRASIGRGFRAPALAERFVSTEVSGLRVIPNPNLSPETAWSSELGNTTRWSERLRSDAALFWTEAYDLIEPNVNAGSGEIQFRNVARARLLGLDLALEGSPLTSRLTTSFAYTLLYARELARDTTPARPLAFRPKHLLTLGADYRWGPFGVGGDFRYTSRFERVEVYPDDPRVDAKVLDLRASWESGQLAARVLLTNALGYIYNLVPRTLAPVRTLSVTLTWTY
jgi:outer membrane receptor protein involved in Fe transport